MLPVPGKMNSPDEIEQQLTSAPWKPSYFYFDCIDTDFRTGGGLSKEKAERCGHPDAAYLPSTGSILLSRMVLDHTNSVSKSSLDRS
eukprot:scaffold1030_cov82-Skeletonema_marinoi.AAC.3